MHCIFLESMPAGDHLHPGSHVETNTNSLNPSDEGIYACMHAYVCSMSKFYMHKIM